MTHNWQLPPDFIKDYLAACKKAATDDEEFANFRQDPHITTVIENTPKWWADRAMEKMGMTPTMVRYMYTLSLMENLIGFHDSIIEIGGGYGGMYEVIKDEWFKDKYEIAEYDDTDENKSEDELLLWPYTIYDLPEVVSLQKRYLTYRKIPHPSFRTNLKCQAPPADLCLSWCAWSELSYDLRVEYAEKVISKCDHFFICSNYNKQEDLEILSKYFTGIKEYNDELVQNVIYA